jgi:hypothetical protein
MAALPVPASELDAILHGSGKDAGTTTPVHPGLAGLQLSGRRRGLISKLRFFFSLPKRSDGAERQERKGLRD